MSNPSQNTAMAIIAYILFFVPLLTGDAKKDAFVKFHTKQGLVLFLAAMIINVFNWMIPYYYSWWWPLNSLLSLAIFVLVIVGIINAASGKQQPLPVIGKFSDMFKF